MVDDLTRVGVVVRPHGIRGELVVTPEGATLESAMKGDSIWLGAETAPRRVVSVRPHKGRWLFALEDVPDRTAAESWRGAEVRVASTCLAGLTDDEIWAHEIVGYRVEAADGTPLGVVRELVPSSPHDLLEIENDGATALVPMVRDWLVRLSREDRCMTLELPAGLLEATAGNRR